MDQKQWDSPPAMQIDASKSYKATVDTDKGKIEIELYPEHAPKTVNNFVFTDKLPKKFLGFFTLLAICSLCFLQSIFLQSLGTFSSFHSVFLFF